MKIGIYNPYFDSLGGGERYVLTLAEYLSQKHTVTLFWDDKEMPQIAEDRFNLDLSKVIVKPNFFISANFAAKLYQSSQYDVIFFLSDGSVPVSLARYNILHFQVPFSHVSMPSWKAARYQQIVCNSEFTKKHLDKSLHIQTSVIYPPVDIDNLLSGKKTKTILSVGRFSGQYGAKKQDVLIQTFREGVEKGTFTGWKLIFAGGLLPSDIAYFEQLQQKADGLVIDFHPNCSFIELRDLYSTASVYWHAAGYGETNPLNMEHFGITTVEAMASGCIPVVFDGGGQSDIIHDSMNGYLWTTKEELIKKTLLAMKKSSATRKIIPEAKKTAREFSKAHFTQQFDGLLQRICHFKI
jgi:glycosyltransferase involved in cell wall biosynthesis